MKQEGSPNTTVPNDSPEPSKSRRQKHRLPKSLSDQKVKIFVGVFLLIILVTAYILAHRSFSKRKPQIELQSVSTLHPIEVEVLDGTGRMKTAQQATNVIRGFGYDVVEMKRGAEGIVERSYIIDRSGNLDAARKMAEKLGIPPDKVFQKIDKSLYLDITVMVGKDFSNLRVFKEFSERNTY
jgi:hypothetical protein